MPARRLHPGQGVARDGRDVTGTSPARRSSACWPTSRPSTASVTRPASRRSSTALQGPDGAAEEPQDHDLQRHGHAAARPRRCPCTGGEAATSSCSGTHVILASGSVPRTIPGFDIDGTLVVTSDELLIDRQAAGLRGRHRRRRHRLRVRVDDERPRHEGDDPRGAAEDPSRVRQRRDAAWCCRSFKKRGIDVRTGVTVDRPRAQRRRHGTTVQFGDGESIEVDLVVMSVGRRPYSDIARPRRHRTRSWSTTGASSRSTSGAAPREAGVWAVGDLIATPQLAHVGFAEGICRDQGHPRRGPGAGRLRQGAVVHLLPSRGRVRRATPRRRRRTRASTSSRRSTATSATAAR